MFSAVSPTHPSRCPCPAPCAERGGGSAVSTAPQNPALPLLPGASRSCLSVQGHSWALGNGRKAAGCGGRQARQPVVLINKAHGHELRGAQRPPGRGQRAGHGGSERQGWKIPAKPRHTLDLCKGKMRALVSFFHRVAMEPGHRAAPRFQLRERSAAGAASASQARCWL